MALKIPVTFLGTSSATPTETRNLTSIFLNYKEENILIDCGEGTQRQIRKAKINPCSITRILITHLHGDHVFGLPGLFMTLGLNNYNKTLFIYGPKGTKEYINNIFKFLINTQKIQYKVEEVNGKFFENKDFEIHALPIEHNINCNGYFLLEKDKLRIDREKLKKLKLPNSPLLSKLIEGKNIKIDNKTIKSKDLTYVQKGRKISFIFDTKLTDNVKKLAKDSDLSVMESTFLSSADNGDDLAKEYFHMTSSQAAKIAKQNKVKILCLTHISQRYEFKEKLILDEAKSIFPNTILAKDFFRVEI